MRNNRKFVFKIKEKFPWFMLSIGLFVPSVIFAFNYSVVGLFIFGINLIILLYYYTSIMQSIFKQESLLSNFNPSRWLFFGFKVRFPKSKAGLINSGYLLDEINKWFDENTAKKSVVVITINNENVFIFQDEQDLIKFIMVWGDKLR